MRQWITRVQLDKAGVFREGRWWRSCPHTIQAHGLLVFYDGAFYDRGAESYCVSPPNFYLSKSPGSKPAPGRISWNGEVSLDTPTSSIDRPLHLCALENILINCFQLYPSLHRAAIERSLKKIAGFGEANRRISLHYFFSEVSHLGRLRALRNTVPNLDKNKPWSRHTARIMQKHKERPISDNLGSRKPTYLEKLLPRS